VGKAGGKAGVPHHDSLPLSAPDLNIHVAFHSISPAFSSAPGPTRQAAHDTCVRRRPRERHARNVALQQLLVVAWAGDALRTRVFGREDEETLLPLHSICTPAASPVAATAVEVDVHHVNFNDKGCGGESGAQHVVSTW
jgi:hypothetical protein